MSGNTVSYWTTNKSSLDAGSPFLIQDTAANIQAALASLATDTHISQIVVQDGPGAEISISVSQITSAATALAILKNLDGTTASVIVSDTAANIGSNFAAHRHRFAGEQHPDIKQPGGDAHRVAGRQQSCGDRQADQRQHVRRGGDRQGHRHQPRFLSGQHRDRGRDRLADRCPPTTPSSR